MDIPECELCDAKFEPRGLVPVCNLCWNKMADERNKALLQLSEAERKGRDLCQQNGELLMALRKIDTMRKRLPDPDFAEQKNTASGIAEIIEVALKEKRKCQSVYTHTSLGRLECEKDEAHLHRVGDVEHAKGNTVWFSV